MNIEELHDHLAASLTQKFRVRERRDTLQLIVPFYFPDGDGLVVHVRDAGDDGLEITDMAHTLMHFGYHSDLDRLAGGTRAELFEGIRHRHMIHDREGELVRPSQLATIAVDILDFVQGLVEVSDLRNLDREIVSSTFKEDLRKVLVEAFPEIQTDYVDPEHDPRGTYPIPYVLNDVPRPVAIFDIATDQNASDALVVARRHAEWRPSIHLMAVERSQEDLGRRVVAWLSDGLDKQFSTLEGNQEAIVRYIKEQHAMSMKLARIADVT